MRSFSEKKVWETYFAKQRSILIQLLPFQASKQIEILEIHIDIDLIFYSRENLKRKIFQSDFKLSAITQFVSF